MRYRELGSTGLKVSEIGLGGEWLERHNTQEVKQVIDACDAAGINILDCWMAEPKVRSNIGAALAGRRQRWIIQGHIGSTWQNGQYVRTREMEKVIPAFEDLLSRLGKMCIRDSFSSFRSPLAAGLPYFPIRQRTRQQKRICAADIWHRSFFVV